MQITQFLPSKENPYEKIINSVRFGVDDFFCLLRSGGPVEV